MKTTYPIAISLLLFISLCINAQKKVKTITIDDAVASGKFYAKTAPDMHSMNSGEEYTELSMSKHIIRYKYASGSEVDTVFTITNEFRKTISYITDYSFNASETKILLTTNQEQIYRHSYTADYYVYDMKKRKITQVSDEGNIQLATFSPKGDKIAYVKQNNLYLFDLNSNKTIQVTNDGKQNEIINGAPDWVYEEEFSFNKAFEWSPDGSKLAYMRFDESKVKEFTLPIYDQLYPTLYTYKYPKAGEENSVVSVWIYNLATGKAINTDIGHETDQYIPRIKWANTNKLCILRLNRLQNHIDVLLTDANAQKPEIIYTETNEKFISGIDDNYIHFLQNGNQFLIISEKDGYKHFYLYGTDGKFINQVTKGNYETVDILGINDTKNTIFYTSKESSPLNSDIYSIKFDGSSKTKLSAQNGTNQARFSSTFRYYVNTWSDANTPPIVTINETNKKQIRVITDNTKLKETIAEYGFEKKQMITIPMPDSLKLNAYMIKPLNFDSTKKYPVLMFVYGGPESQNVLNKWDEDSWFQMLSQKGFIIVCVDNRGTDGRGEEFKKCTYMKLGKLETEDQLNAAKYLAKQPYIDGNRMGIFGWSYGGYMVSSCLTKGAEIFKLGIAVAPVTNWRFYDSVYTERFMRTPEENSAGYDENSPINFTDNLTGKLLLIHGSADDNVHLQNTMVFAEKLINSGKKFDMFIYPNKSHSIPGAAYRLNLYQKMTDFLTNNL